MTFRKHILFITLAAAVVALLVTSQRGKPEIEESEISVGVQTPATVHVQEAQIPEPPQPMAQKTPSIEDVTQVVRERNVENDKRMKAFENDGWESVKVDDPPDVDVMQLSQKLVGKREAELQAQIQSNSFTSDMFGRLTEIALTTTDDKTRYVAIEALGRSGEKSAQLQLTQAFEQITDEETRSQILGYLTPAEPNDEIALFLTEQIADPKISERLKRQAAFPLAMASLLGTSTPEEAMALGSMELPNEWKDNFANIVNLLATGGI